MKLTLRAKLIALTTVLVTGIMASVTYFFTIRELAARRAAVEAQMDLVARNIATMQLLDRQDWDVYQNYISQLIAFSDDIVFIAVYDDRRLLRAYALNADLVEVDRNRPLSRTEEASIVRRLDEGAVAAQSQADLRTRVVNILVGDRVLGSVHVGFSLIDINDELRHGIQRNLAMAAVFLLISVAISFVLGRRLTGPLERLSSAMTAIAAGDVERKVTIESRDEIGELAETYNAMVEGLRERRILEHLGRELGATFQLERLSALVRNRLSEAIGAFQARLFVRSRDGEPGFEELFPEDQDSQARLRITLQDGARDILRRCSGVILEEVPQEVSMAFPADRFGSRDLIIPMLVKDQLFGLLVFSPPPGVGSFNEDQRRFAATLAGQAGLALENALLYEELREQERLKRELEIAREVQRRLLPTSMPRVPGFLLDGVCLPAQEVGGDYYDFLPLSDDQIAIVIADVSGKGTSASFYMAEIKGMVLSLAPVHPSPKTLLVELNRRLYGTLDRRVFATMIYGVLDAHRASFVFARAGHNSLLHLKNGRGCRVLTPGGIGLGLERGLIFEKSLEEVEVGLDEGDTLLLYTDGISEAMNSRFELFSEERLLEVVAESPCKEAFELRDRVLQAVAEFVDGAPQHDDVSMVLVQRRQRA